MSETLRDALPAIYQKLLPAFFDQPAPEEPKATCSSCTMCPPKEPVAGVIYFRPDTKCCTYQPHLPSYLVGEALASEEPALAEGRARLRAHIQTRIGVTPRWLRPSRKYDVLFRAARDEGFGRSDRLLCPYYEKSQGNCTIWRHREAACSTFFCKYGAGADGQTFWRAVRGYLVRVERALSAWAANEIAPLQREPDASMTVAELEDRAPSDADYEAIWGGFAGREEELYRKAHTLVGGLSPAEVARICDASDELAKLEAAHRAVVSPTLPARLKLDLYRPPVPAGDGFLVGTYSTYEPIALSAPLFEILRDIKEGETVAELRARVLAERDVDLSEEILIALHQLRVVIEA
jgi:Fe-S-cluster containining protein